MGDGDERGERGRERGEEDSYCLQEGRRYLSLGSATEVVELMVTADEDGQSIHMLLPHHCILLILLSYTPFLSLVLLLFTSDAHYTPQFPPLSYV